MLATPLKVSHRHLLLKLEHYGIRGPTLSWIGDFLANRTQRVMIEGTQSETAPVTSGVPQGSVLGPLLFLCYTNDLPTCISSDIRLFAYDCLLYRTIHSQQDAVILQEYLNMLQQWEAKWLMSFNPGKCEVLRVNNKRKHIIHTHYKIHGMILDTVGKTKYLGVTIQSKLNWKPHTQYHQEGQQRQGVLTEKSLQLPPSRERTSIQDLCAPHLIICIHCLGPPH